MPGFGDCDKTGDGLCLDEFVNYLEREHHVKISKDIARDVFQKIDGRKVDDDRITWAEWEEFQNTTPFTQVKKEDLMKAFDDADKDGSGKLNSCEMLQKLKSKGYDRQDVTDIIKNIDLDNDSEINRNEWEKVVDEMIAKAN
ncbi:calcium-dependent protein kinase 2 [Octopus sinensis]|uniref:Calcium-dependent protein kinase 2 n=1 Tax=Octopus sinensis TaxID=2607531 RepID=A0A6P7T1V7_9MOLL|nr:calcium-dependent protein kinase 2 [Octopus sinensis]